MSEIKKTTDEAEEKEEKDQEVEEVEEVKEVEEVEEVKEVEEVEEVKEVKKVKEVKEMSEEKKDTGKAKEKEKTTVKSKVINEILSAVEKMTVLELAELVKALEEKFEVSAQAVSLSS